MNRIEGNEINNLEKKLNFGIKDENSEINEQLSALVEKAAEKSRIEQLYTTVHPEPGFCVKTATTEGTAIYINVCHSDKIPCIDLEHDVLETIIKDPNFKLPMSITDLRDVDDEKKKKVIDVAFHTNLYATLIETEPLIPLIYPVIITAIEEKHDVIIENSGDNFRILKNRTMIGSLATHYIPRNQEKLWHQIKPPVREVTSEVFETPKYVLFKSPEEKYYLLKIMLPEITSVNQILCRLNSSTLRLSTNGKIKYHLEINFPEDIIEDKYHAVFETHFQISTFILPILPAK